MSLEAQLGALERAELIRLAQSLPEVEYTFQHALVQEAAYGSLLRSTRRELHRLIGEAIERLHPDRADGQAAVLAAHFAEGDEPVRALDYYRRAAEQAQARYANEEAIALYGAAIAMAERAGHGTAALRQARGKIHELVGSREAARGDYEAVRAEAERGGDRRVEFQAVLDIGFLFAAHDYQRMGEYLLRATELARGLDDPRLLAESLNRLGNWYVNTERPREGIRCHREALALCEAAGSREGIAATRDMLSIAGLISGDAVAAAENAQRAIEIFREMNRPLEMAATMSSRALLRSVTEFGGVQVLPAATAEDCLRELDEALAIARRIGWRPGEAFALGNSGMLWTARGDYAMALDRSEASLALAREIGHAQWEVLAHLALFELWLALRDEERGMAHGRRGLDMARSVGSRHLQRSVAGVLAARLARWGAGAALAQAERDIASALDAGATPEDAQTIGQRHCWVGRAEIALARGDAASALQVADALLGSLPNLGAPGTTGTGPVLAHLRGRCCIALGRYAEASRELQSVRAIAAAHGARTLELRAELGFVALFRARGSTAELDDAQARCRALAQSLAATIPEAAARKRYLDWMHAEIGE